MVARLAQAIEDLQRVRIDVAARESGMHSARGMILGGISGALYQSLVPSNWPCVTIARWAEIGRRSSPVLLAVFCILATIAPRCFAADSALIRSCEARTLYNQGHFDAAIA